MTYDDRLTERDMVTDSLDGGVCAIGLVKSFVAVVVEAVGAYFGAVYQARVFVSYFSAEFD